MFAFFFGKAKVTIAYLLKAIKFGIKAHLGNVLATLNYRIDLYLVNFFLSPLHAGIYVVAVQLSERIWIISHSVGSVIFPKLSEISSHEEQKKSLTPIIARYVLLSSILLSIVLAIISYPIILIFFSDSYMQALNPLFCLMPGIVLLSVSRVLSNDIASRGKPEYNLYTSFLVLLVNIAFNILLIPTGILGAAIATTISYSVNTLLKLFQYSSLSKK